MTQITNLDALAGKTIAKAVSFGGVVEHQTIGLVFADGTYAYLSIDSDRDGDRWISLEDEPDDPEKVALGLVSQEDYDRVMAERQAAIDAACDQQDRREYERLRAKFESEARP
jgi:hypothetical protein